MLSREHLSATTTGSDVTDHEDGHSDGERDGGQHEDQQEYARRTRDTGGDAAAAGSIEEREAVARDEDDVWGSDTDAPDDDRDDHQDDDVQGEGTEGG